MYLILKHTNIFESKETSQENKQESQLSALTTGRSDLGNFGARKEIIPIFLWRIIDGVNMAKEE